MKKPISAVIICLNAGESIGQTIRSLKSITDDIVVSDSGSTDDTKQKVEAAGARLLEIAWTGYGANKNAAGRRAVNDWILSLDADEWVEDDFTVFMSQVILDDPKVQYQFRRLNYLGNKPIRYGEWSRDKVVRLFNRAVTSWDDAPVHEQLRKPAGAVVLKGDASIRHRTAPNIKSYRIKIMKYAKLMADKNYAQGKTVSLIKLWFSPLFNFIQNYVFRLGILDGAEGWQIAAAHAGYTYEKYRLLREMRQH